MVCILKKLNSKHRAQVSTQCLFSGNQLWFKGERTCINYSDTHLCWLILLEGTEYKSYKKDLKA